MKTILNTFIMLSVLILYSCKNETAADETALQSDSAKVAASAGDAVPQISNAGEVQQLSTPPGATTPDGHSPGATTSPTTTAAGMNPAHGQPGHRCDIDVGAPLNSPPKPVSAQPTITTTPGINSSSTPPPVSITAPPPATSTPPAATLPGMNPPHGQPGHDCAVAVGAPLKK